MTRRFLFWSYSLLFVLSYPLSGLARTWEIDAVGSGDAPTIQAGVDSAIAGDTLRVGLGRYFGTVNFSGKNIVIESVMGPAFTVLDGSAVGPVVVFEGGENNSAVLSGFTVTRGAGGLSTPGGGICILDAEPTIINNIITLNEALTANGFGGGLYCSGSIGTRVWVPVIKHNMFSLNSARMQGGAIYAVNSMAPRIVENQIVQNHVVEGDGGGISLRLIVDGAVVSSNRIHENLAGDHGAGIYVGLASNLRGPIDIEVSWNVVSENTASGSSRTEDCGGGVWISGTNARVYRNTIVANGCGVDRPAGGLVLRGEGTPLIDSNIIALSRLGGGLFCHSGVVPILVSNIVWNNVGGDGGGTCQDWVGRNGNAHIDPRFCNAEGFDYSLAEDSPARLAGAIELSGCPPVSQERVTWGRIKALYVN